MSRSSHPADHSSKRHSASFSIANKIFRVAWGLTWLLLARFTPPPAHRWRCLLLRLFGAKIGAKVRIYGSCQIWNPRNLTILDGSVLGRRVNCYNQGDIYIGRGVVISQDSTLCASTHDVENPDFPLLLRPITIEDHVWVAAEAFVGPGVTIGEGAVLGARGVAMRRLEGWFFHSGNPAQPLKARRPFPSE